MTAPKVLTLDQCGETLTVKQLCAVLQISRDLFYRLRDHGTFPIQPLQGFGGKCLFSKTAVRQYLDNQPTTRKRSA